MAYREKVSCNECGKKMATIHMEGHMNIHAGKRPFKCTLCPKTYPSKKSCDYHYWLIHGLRGKDINPKAHPGAVTQGEKSTLTDVTLPRKHHEVEDVSCAEGLELVVSVPIQVNVCSDAIRKGVNRDTADTVSPESTGNGESIKSQQQNTGNRDNSIEGTPDLGMGCELERQTTARTVSKEKSFQCSQCNRTYRYKHGLTRHCRNMHSKTFQCTECSLGYSKESTLIRHYKSYHPACVLRYSDHQYSERLECLASGTKAAQSYRGKAGLGKHCQKKHNGHGYDLVAVQCSECRQLFIRRRNLVRHCHNKHGGLGYVLQSTDNHTQGSTSGKEKPGYPCSCCDLIFHSLKSYKAHLFSHSGSTTLFLCTVCGREYDSVAKLWRHQRGTHRSYHRRQLLQKCTCSTRNKARCYRQLLHRRFQFKKTLPQSFKNRGHFKRTFQSASAHKKGANASSTGEAKKAPRPQEVDTQTPAMSLDPVVVPLNTASGSGYKCTLCGKVLTRITFFREHMNLHTGARPYVCEVCSMAFSHASRKTRHMMKHSNPIAPSSPNHRQQTRIQVKGKIGSEPVVSEAQSSHQPTKKQIKHKKGSIRKVSSHHQTTKKQFNEHTSLSDGLDTSIPVSNGEAATMQMTSSPHDEIQDVTFAATLDRQCFSCETCDVSLQHYAAYMEHLDQHAQSSNVNSGTQPRHQNRHAEPSSPLSSHKVVDGNVSERKRFACQKCDKSWTHASSRRRHILTEHPEKAIRLTHMQLRSEEQLWHQEISRAGAILHPSSAQGSHLEPKETASGDTELQQQPLSSGSVEGHSGNVQGPSVRPVCGEAGVEVGNREALSTTVWLME